MIRAWMSFQTLAIVIGLQKEGPLVAPHIIEHGGGDMAGEGHQSHEMTLVGVNSRTLMYQPCGQCAGRSASWVSRERMRKNWRYKR